LFCWRASSAAATCTAAGAARLREDALGEQAAARVEQGGHGARVQGLAVRVDVQLEVRVRGLQERAHARPQLGPQVEVRQVVQAGRLAGRCLRRQQRPQPRARRFVHLQRSGRV
jgi:hypothetical protein